MGEWQDALKRQGVCHWMCAGQVQTSEASAPYGAGKVMGNGDTLQFIQDAGAGGGVFVLGEQFFGEVPLKPLETRRDACASRG